MDYYGDMWQLLDIAYIIPVTVAIGYFLGTFLESKYEGDYLIASILIFMLLGFILTIVRIKRALDEMNDKSNKKD